MSDCRPQEADIVDLDSLASSSESKQTDGCRDRNVDEPD